MVERRQMDKILRSKRYDSSSNCVYFGILVMKDLKLDFLYMKWTIKAGVLTST